MNILFLCIANSARSQMAEGLSRKILGSKVYIQSAGSFPGLRVHPSAITVLKEIGIDISQQKPKSVQDIDLNQIDMVITLCADEVCPVVLHGVKKLHWPLPDPVGERDEMENFRKIREELIQKLKKLKKEDMI